MATSLVAKPFLGRTGSLARPNAAQPVRPRGQMVVKAADRPMWLPGSDPPEWLDGRAPGDFGFDPLSLGCFEDRLQWFQEAEKTNGRWAMAAVAGIMGQELLGVQPRWFDAGAKDYGVPNNALLAIEFLVLGFLELKRYQGWRATGQSGLIDKFPFDPVGLNSDSMATKEIKNGRLAMIAFVGFSVQALVTRKGPLENLFDHIGNPFGNNIITSIGSLPQTLSTPGL